MQGIINRKLFKMKKVKIERAWITSFIVHALLLMLAIFPLIGLLKTDASQIAVQHQVIVITFENGVMSPSSSSTGAKEIKAEKLVDKPLVNRVKPDLEEAEKSTPVRNEEIGFVDQSNGFMDQGENENFASIAEPVRGEMSDINIGDVSDSGGGSKTAGEGQTGEEITGMALANMDFEGEGVFGRQIVYHANISKLAEQAGRVVVNLCINRIGVVTHVAFNREASTLTESNYVKEVMRVAAKYRFEQDYNAPKVQCGKLTFIFEFN
jgi:hypothetical protein